MKQLATFKKAASTAVIACLAVSALTACGSDKDSTTSTAGGTSPSSQASAKKEISISVFDRGEVPAEEGNYESNRWTEWINNNAPVTVKWVPVPRNEAQTKLNTLIASGGAPDLIWEYDRNYIAQLVNQGAIQPVDSYIAKYSTSYKKYLEEHPELDSYLTFDGKKYAVASVRGVESVANHGMWIRQDWLDKLGLKTPTTVDELLEVARKFKDDDPDGNGKADTVPIVFNGNGVPIIRELFMASESQWYVNGDKLEYGRVTDRYMDSLAFQKQLFDSGLIDKEYITDKNFQRSMQFWTTGKAGIMLGSWNMEAEFLDLKKNVPEAKMTALESLSTQYGKSGLYQEASPGIFVTFNGNLKEDKIEAAFKFLDWMIDTGWKPLKYGEENVHYKDVDGVPQISDADKFRKEVTFARELPIVNQYEQKPEWFPVMAASDALSQEYAKEKANSLTLAMKNKYRRDIAYGPSQPEVSQLIATFSPIAQQIEAKIVTGGTSMTAQTGIDEIRKEWKRLGGDTVEKIVNEWYLENKSQLK